MADFDRIERLAQQDFATAAKHTPLHHDEHFHILWVCWRSVEQSAQECGWDIFKAYVRTVAASRATELRVRLLLVLPEQLRIARTAIPEAAFLAERQKTYGDSWKKRGGVGAFMMLARKWDRIETISKGDAAKLRAAIAEDTGGIVDDIDDLRRYLLLVEDECFTGEANAAYVDQARDAQA